jgi:hypothetical protein
MSNMTVSAKNDTSTNLFVVEDVVFLYIAAIGFLAHIYFFISQFSPGYLSRNVAEIYNKLFLGDTFHKRIMRVFVWACGAFVAIAFCNLSYYFNKYVKADLDF